MVGTSRRQSSPQPEAIEPGCLIWLQRTSGSDQADGQALQRRDGLGFAASAAARIVAEAIGANLLLFGLR